MGYTRLVLSGLTAGCFLLVGMPPLSAVELPPQVPPVAVERTHGPDPIQLDRRGRAPSASYAADEPAPWTKAEYDGLAPTTDQPDLTTLPALHAVYVYPADAPSRFSTYAAMFEADARQAASLLTSLYGRSIRFDERQATNGPGTMLDITVFRSKYSAKKLKSSQQFSLVANELKANSQLNKANKKYMVWLDAGSRYCGQANLAQDTTRSAGNANEGRSYAIVYRPYSSDLDDGVTGGFCRGRTLRHEIGHNLGALQAVAPNSFDDAHCDDSAEDTMCYTSRTSNDTGGPVFDHGNDDYWDPAANPSAGSSAKLGWWTANLSRFICPAAGCQVANDPAV